MRTNNILLIDDSDMDNFINEAILKRNNAARVINTVRSAEEALEFLADRVYKSEAFPDIILLDLSMPGMGGFGFLEKFIQFPFAKQESCTVVVLTSSFDPEDFKRAKRNQSVKHYVQKPLTDIMVNIIFEGRDIQPDKVEKSLSEDAFNFIYSSPLNEARGNKEVKPLTVAGKKQSALEEALLRLLNR